MKKFSLLILSLFSLALSAQHTNILIDDNQAGYKPCEPSIIINPQNPDHIVAGAIINRYYYSLDGGESWEKGFLESPWGVWGDPVLIVDTTGAYYYFHLANPPIGVGSWIDRIISQKLDQPGGTWDQKTYMGKNGTKAQDKEWAIVDRDNNNIYVTWTQFDEYNTSNPDYYSNILFSKSTDGGQNWSDALQINEISGDCIDSDNTVEGAVPAVGPNGEIYVAWVGPAGLVFDRSYDQGETWLDEDIFISDVPGGWDYAISGINRCNGLPVTKCDLSGGPDHGTIYVNWTDQRNGSDDTDVWLVKSTDGGDTWTEPSRVNDDPPGKQQFFTWMDVDQATGYLWFVWYDRRNYENNNTDVYMAVSRDGGETFINFKVSESPFLPTSNIFFGDYTNVSAYDNVIRPIWARLNAGELSIWTALVDPYIVGLKEEIPSLASLEQNYPNPFRVSTKIAYKVKEPGNVSLSIYNMYGDRVVNIFRDKYHFRGKFIESFEPSEHALPAGVYFFQLSTANEVLKRTMVFVK